MNAGMQKPIVVLMFSCALAQSFAAGSEKLAITGQVVDYLARPVQGADVVVYQREHRHGDYSAKVITPIRRTDREGRFALEAETTSQYDTFIVARKEGLALAWDGLNYSRNTLGKGYFLLVLEKPCTLTGVVVDDSGKPVAGAQVQALPKTSYMSRLRQRPMYGPAEWFTTETNREGLFRFDAFAADVNSDFQVKASALNCTYKFTTHIQNSCGFEVGRPDIRLVLPRERRVQGRAVDEKTGQGVAGVELVIEADRDREDILNRYLVQTVVTGAEGTFRCAGLPEGKNRIRLAPVEDKTPEWVAGPVSVNVVVDQIAKDVRVTLSQGGIIEADVRERGADRPLSGARIWAYGRQGSAASVTNDSGPPRVRVAPGEYEVSAGADAYAPWRVNQPVVVRAGQTTHLDISLDRAPTIQGRVTDQDGKPADDVQVTVHPFGDHVYTDAQGRFTAGYDERRTGQGLCLIARDLRHSHAAVIHTEALDQPVTLSLGPALTVRGKVTDTDGHVVPTARVSLCARLFNCLSSLGPETLADAQGCYEISAVPPQQEPFEYRISVHAAGFGPKTYRRIAIEGEPGAIAEVETLALVPANLSASGTVVDANGLPAPGVPIFVNSIVGVDQPPKATATDVEGRFALSRLCKGPIRLQADFASSPKGSGTIKAEAGDQDLRIVLGQSLVHSRLESLKDQPLPSLRDLDAGLDDADVRGRAILVCFWDMQQRPSRRALMQLAEKAETIRGKGIAVVAVETSGAEREQLDEWMRQYKVPFTSGITKGPFDEKKLAWGVKSLPWLILTDKGHVVRAEGFGLDELNDRIEETE